MTLEMNYIDRTELAGSAPPGLYDGYTEQELDSLITRASMLMRRATRTAFYAVDASGMPTGEKILRAFREATAAQVQAWVEAGVARDLSTGGANTSATVRSSSNNGSSITVDTSLADAARLRLLGGGLSEGAALILEDAGLIGQMPYLEV